MRKVAVFYNPRVGGADLMAEQVRDWFEQRGCETSLHASEPSGVQVAQVEGYGREQLSEAELLVILGGDGSVLRAAHVAAPLSIPMVGINLGRVGFLTEAGPERWRHVLARVLEGQYWVEERMMLRAEAFRDGSSLCCADALNEVVVGRGARARVVHLRTVVDGGELATYVADGLIVASPTGSTAYALAAGGPVLPPQLRNILLVPVAPHLSMARPVVLSEGVVVRIVVEAGREAVLTVDGEVHAGLASGDEVKVAASENQALFARVQSRTYFYKTLGARLVPRH